MCLGETFFLVQGMSFADLHLLFDNKLRSFVIVLQIEQHYRVPTLSPQLNILATPLFQCKFFVFAQKYWLGTFLFLKIYFLLLCFEVKKYG